MSRIYNNFRVLRYDLPRGEVTLAWYDDQQPYNDQLLLEYGHKIPIEAEDNNWTRAQYLAFWLGDVPDIAEIPQWMKDEAHKTYSYTRTIAEPV